MKETSKKERNLMKEYDLDQNKKEKSPCKINERNLKERKKERKKVDEGV